MTRNIRRFNEGRLRLWLHLYEPRLKREATLLALLLFGLYMAIAAIGRMVQEHEQQIAALSMRAAKAEYQLAYERALHGMPNPAIVIDANSAKKYGLRIAEISNGLHEEAYRAQFIK
jgi:hypothetical protein